MARRFDPVRIATARRAATIARLISEGELPDRAAAWVARWEAAIDGSPSRADWESFDAWIAGERAAVSRPRSAGAAAQPAGSAPQRAAPARQDV